MSQFNQNWRDTLMPLNSKIKDAIKKLNLTGLKIVIVVDSDGRLLGTISDGDIRRGLLKGLEIDSPIESIVYRDALVVPAEMDTKIVMQLMIANKIFKSP